MPQYTQTMQGKYIPAHDFVDTVCDRRSINSRQINYTTLIPDVLSTVEKIQNLY